MANDNYEGFSDESLENALGIRDAVQEIQRSTRLLNRELGVNSNTFGTYFNKIQSSADAVATIQEKARKSSKGTAAALQEQTKQLLVVKQLNIQIDQLYDKASRSNARTRYNLERQARNLAEARDNAQELAKTYGKLAEDSAKLTRTGKFFDTLSMLTEKTPLLNKFSTPFQKAAEASRKAAIENAKMARNKEQIKKLTQDELNGTRNISAAKLKQLGLDKIAVGRSKEERAAALQAYQNTKAASQAGAGMRAAGTSFSQAGGFLGKAGWIGLLITAIQFFVELLVSAQERTVEIAKDLSITRESAELIRQDYIAIAGASGNLLANTKSLVEAQQAFSDYSQAVSFTTGAALQNQVFLTKNLNIAAKDAADFNELMLATRVDIEGSTDMFARMSKNFGKIYGFSVPTAKLIKAIAGSSKEIQGYFGFSVKRIGEAVLRMSKFGVELQDALSISKALLDFESSIGNELELELLTGKELNLEKARALTLTGKIDMATNEVLSQMQNLTEEQRRNPLIMESMAKLTGLSADQLNRAYIVQTKLSKETRAYYEELQRTGKQKEANYLVDLLGETATKEEMKKTLTVQEAFQAALEKAKDQFTGLVDSGVLDKLVDVLSGFVDTMEYYNFGSEARERRVAEQMTATKKTLGTNLNEVQQRTLEKLRLQAGGERGIWKGSIGRDISDETFARAERTGMRYEEVQKQMRQESQRKLQLLEEGKLKLDPKKERTLEVDDFVIKPMDKDTITMAGGTKLGGNVETLLQELIKEVKGGKNIYIGPNKINESIGLNLHSIG